MSIPWKSRNNVLIVPIVPEAEWLRMLQRADVWIPPAKPTLVISPHPDDETLGAGGLIAEQMLRGLNVTVVAVTDGESAYLERSNLAETRRIEQEEAAKRLGLSGSLIRLGLPDAALSKHQSQMEELLCPLIEGDTLVLAPWINDWHPDHEACARVALKLCAGSGAELISYLFWTWHQRTTDVFGGVRLFRFNLSPDIQLAKQSALQCYASQLRHEAGDPILPPSLLAPAYRTFETFISHV